MDSLRSQYDGGIRQVPLVSFARHVYFVYLALRDPTS